jgi:hypothetical protein
MKVKEQMKIMEEYMRLFFQVYQILPEPEQCWTFRDFNQKQRNQTLEDLAYRVTLHNPPGTETGAYYGPKDPDVIIEIPV